MTVGDRFARAIAAFFDESVPERANDADATDRQARRLAFYEACLNGWLSTSFEKDKSVLTISAGAIAIIFGVFTQFKGSQPWILCTFTASAVLFFLTILVVIFIFSRNREIFQRLANDEKPPSLEAYDRVVDFAFCIAVALLLVAGIGQAFTSTEPDRGGTNMADRGKEPPRVVIRESADGFQKLAPKSPPPPPPQKAPPAGKK